jgi:hypothetical protein
MSTANTIQPLKRLEGSRAESIFGTKYYTAHWLSGILSRVMGSCLRRMSPGMITSNRFDRYVEFSR